MGGIDADLVQQAMTPADAEGAVPLSVEACWNQTAADWRFMLRHGGGLGVREPDGRWIASSLTLPLGEKLAWISMVLVAKEHRRRGIGTRLLRHCIAAVRASEAAAGLDATELGRPVYLPLGFRDLYAISRWRLEPGIDAAQPAAEYVIRPVVAADIPALAAFETAHAGLQRESVLRYLFAQAPRQAFITERAGRLAGYVLGRPGHAAFHVGPLVAADETLALALLRRALAAMRGPTIVDVPDAHAGVRAFLARKGAARQRGFTRMVLGEPPRSLVSPRLLFALAGPELG